MTTELKTLIDRPMLPQTQLLDKMVAELSQHLSPIELDMLIDKMAVLSTSKWDVNFSVTDAVTWISDIIGQERYDRAKQAWSTANQKSLTVFGNRKYRDKKTHILYDGLDDTDIESDFEIIYV